MSKITFDVKGEVSGHQCVRDAVRMEDGPSLSVKRPLGNRGNRGNPAPVSKMSESATPKAHVRHRKTLQVL